MLFWLSVFGKAFFLFSQRRSKKKRGKLNKLSVDRGKGIWKSAENHLLGEV
jgi:hypothetical protein